MTAFDFGWDDQSGRQYGSPFAALDTLGRKQPRRLGAPDYLLLVARIEPGRVRRVPAPAVTEEGRDDDGEYALIACPCGARPVARLALAKCPGCERYFVFVEEGAVYVAYGDMELPGCG